MAFDGLTMLTLSDLATMRKVSPLLALLAILPAFLGVRAADWPAWGGSDFGRNMVSSETGLPETFKPGDKSTTGDGILPETTENVRWVTKLGTFICGNPTVSDGRVFVGTDDESLQHDPRLKRTRGGMIWCLDEKTGGLLWRLPVPARPKDRLPVDAHYGQQNLGVCSSPAVAGDRVYVVTNAAEILCLDVHGQANGNHGPFMDEGQYIAGAHNPPVALEKTDGDILWKYDLVDDLGVCPHDVAACSVLVDGRFVYCTSCNGVNHEHTFCLHPDAPSFIALDALTGKLLAADAEDLGHRLWHCLWSPPTIGVVNGKKLVFFGGGDGVCYAFEALQDVPSAPVQFKKVWSFDCDPPEFRHPEGEDEFNYYIGDRRKRYTTNQNDGLFLGPSEIIASPVFHDGRVYCTIGQDPMHGRGRGLLHCIDASKTGDPGWPALCLGPGRSRPLSRRKDRQALLGVLDRRGNVEHAARGRWKGVYQHQEEARRSRRVPGTQGDLGGPVRLRRLRYSRRGEWDALCVLAKLPMGCAERRQGHARPAPTSGGAVTRA
jgi:outer membrane protein assembly factor BamB